MRQPDHTENFVRLLVANQRRICGLIAAMVPNPADADDLLQEVSAALWRKFDRFEPGTDFSAWALKFARLEVLRFYRRSKRSRLRFGEDLLKSLADEAEALAPSSDIRHEALQRCIGRLNEKARHIISLRYEPNATVASVAEAIGRSPNVVYKALNKIHSFLLACIQRQLAAEAEQ